MKDYVWARETSEIQSAIDNSISSNDQILYWQSCGNEKMVLSGIILLQEPTEKNIIVSCDKPSELRKLDKRKEIFVKLKNRNTVFKSKIVHIAKDNVEVQLPSEVKTVELRKSIRNEIQEESFALIEKIDSSHLGKMQFSFGLLNESESGFGLSLSVSKMNLFQIGETVKIIKMKGKYLGNPIVCKIIHITKNESENLHLKNTCKFGVEIV